MSTSTENLSTEAIRGLYAAACKLVDQADSALKVCEAAVVAAEAQQLAAWDEVDKWSLELDRRYDMETAA